MSLEIEHKYLVQGDYRSLAASSTHIVQGYLCRDADRTVRIRLRDDKGYITIKGKSTGDGLQRFEWEREISAGDAWQLMKLCLPGVVDKRRYLVPWRGHTFEVDEFAGDNAGLVMAEVEVSRADEDFDKPPFIGKEVTGDERYYNSYLARCPYTQWPE